MWDKDDPKSKWFHLALKVIAALVIFKLGVLVGEFKIIKKMVVGGGDRPKMLIRGGDGGAETRYFHKRAMPMMGAQGDVMMWKAGVPVPEAPEADAPAPVDAAQT